MIAEIYDALKHAGASEDKARKAAEVMAAGKHTDLLRQFERLEGRFKPMTWILGINITLTLLVLGRLFIGK